MFSPTDAALRIDFRPGQANTGAAVGETYAGIEGVHGTDNNDTFIIGQGQTLFAAGGGGRDTFITKAPDSTMIALGGDGTDVFRLDYDGLVLAVDIPGVTQDNFHLLTQAMLESALGLPLSDFRMIIVNPDPLDRLTVSGTTLARTTSSFDFSVGTWADQVGAASETVPNTPVWSSFNLPDNQFLEIRSTSIQTASGGHVVALWQSVLHMAVQQFEAYTLNNGVYELMDQGPGDINEWMNDPPDGDLVEWTPNVVGADTVGIYNMPFVEVAGVREFVWHVEESNSYGDAFALVGGLSGHSISAGMTLNITLPPIPETDWV